MNHASETSVIVDQAALSEKFTPEKLLHREEQVQQISRCLSPAAKKRRPIHLWLHGKPGSGKTATVLYVLKHLKEKSCIDGLLVNCWQKGTFFEILDQIIPQLRILRAEEHRTSLKLEKLTKHLGSRPFVMVLDEVDQIKPAERSTTLYNLDCLENVGIICISNSQQALFELDARVRSRINPYSVAFPAYSHGDLVEILGYRAETALAASTYSRKDLTRIAEMASGDARVAIRSLQVSAELAENETWMQFARGVCRSSHAIIRTFCNNRDTLNLA